jgi:hypothetical protein
VAEQPLTVRGLWHAWNGAFTRLGCFLSASVTWWLDLPILQAVLVAVAVLSFVLFILWLASIRAQRDREPEWRPTKGDLMPVVFLFGTALAGLFLFLGLHGSVSTREQDQFDLGMSRCVARTTAPGE